MKSAKKPLYSREDLLAIMRVRDLCARGEAYSIREKARLSQSEIANALSTTRGAISRYERGMRVPSGRTALEYGKILDALEAQLNEAR